MKKLAAAFGVLVLVGVGVGAILAARSSSPSERTDPSVSVPTVLESETEQEVSGLGVAAMDQAARDGKYFFAFFFKEESDQTFSMRAVFESAMGQVNEKADSIQIDVNNQDERAIVAKFGADRAPLPLVLAVAPNGAVTGGFPTKFEENDLVEAIASPCTQECMKHLQDGKLVFICVQNGQTGAREAALQGVRDFQSDPSFAQMTELVQVDPADASEATFLSDLQISPETKEAVTVFLAPPGVPLAMFEGATTKEKLAATLNEAASNCGPGVT